MMYILKMSRISPFCCFLKQSKSLWVGRRLYETTYKCTPCADAIQNTVWTLCTPCVDPIQNTMQTLCRPCADPIQNTLQTLYKTQCKPCADPIQNTVQTLCLPYMDPIQNTVQTLCGPHTKHCADTVQTPYKVLITKCFILPISITSKHYKNILKHFFHNIFHIFHIGCTISGCTNSFSCGTRVAICFLA